MADAFRGELEAADLTLSMWRVLACLHQQGPQRIGELSRLSTIEASTLSRVVDQMEDRGMVTRTRSGEDRRVVTVDLTASGEDLTEQLIPLALRYERMALKGVTEADIVLLNTLLMTIYENLEQAEGEVVEARTPVD